MAIRRGIFFSILLALGVPGTSSLAGPVRLVPHLFVKVDILGVRNKATTTLARRTIEVSQEKPGVAVFPLDSYRAGDGLILREIEVRLEAGPAREGALQLGIVTLARVVSAGGEVQEIRRERRAPGEDGASFIHPVYEIPYGGGNVLAALIVETRNVPELEQPKMGSPVIFQVALVRATPGGPVPIEETIMRTLDGSAVSYSFRRKSADASSGDGASESLELTLLPRRTSDEILMVDASVDLRRSAPDGGPQAEPLLVKRSQAMTRGSAFELKLDKAPASEDPYRLIIHAQF